MVALWQERPISTSLAADELALIHYDFLGLLGAEGIPVVRRSPVPERIKEAQRKLATKRS